MADVESEKLVHHNPDHETVVQAVKGCPFKLLSGRISLTYKGMPTIRQYDDPTDYAVDCDGYKVEPFSKQDYTYDSGLKHFRPTRVKEYIPDHSFWMDRIMRAQLEGRPPHELSVGMNEYGFNQLRGGKHNFLDTLLNYKYKIVGGNLVFYQTFLNKQYYFDTGMSFRLTANPESSNLVLALGKDRSQNSFYKDEFDRAREWFNSLTTSQDLS